MGYSERMDIRRETDSKEINGEIHRERKKRVEREREYK